nr:hypothetical protein [Streptomyces sp. HNM0574]
MAATAGSALVTQLTTEAWQGARDRFVALWRRARPERAEGLAAEIEATRDDLLAADEAGDPDTAPELSAEWQGRIRRLLAARPDVADELRTLLEELAPPQAPAAVTQTATASGSARVYQAGRDLHLGPR